MITERSDSRLSSVLGRLPKRSAASPRIADFLTDGQLPEPGRAVLPTTAGHRL
jgi:hypothetical protein